MNTIHSNSDTPFRLTFDGKMTYEHSHQIEDRIIDAMRRHRHFEVDLSKVEEIDLCGIHLVSLLRSTAVIVATSPIVEEASRRALNAKPRGIQVAA